MRRGQPVPSGSQADSAYDRYAMGKQAYHAPANDGCDDWDESFPCAIPHLFRVCLECAAWTQQGVRQAKHISSYDLQTPCNEQLKRIHCF